MSQITVLIVDDNFVIRRGLRSLLELDENIEILGEASTGLEAVQWVRNSPVDVVLMDIRMPNMGGIKATADILTVRPESKVLMITIVEDPLTVAQAIIAGAKGYLTYGRFNSEELSQAINTVHNGGAIITPAVAPVLLDLAGDKEIAKAQEGEQAIPGDSLTSREKDILMLIAAGKGNREIAETLSIEEKTVKNYINNIYSKLRLKSRYEAISYVMRRQL